MKRYGVFGAGGCGRGILPLARAILEPGDELMFVDDGRAGETINGAPVIGLDHFAGLEGERSICLAIANSGIRRQIDARCRELAIPFFTVRSAQHVAMDDVVIGEGALMSPWTTITSNIRIGRHFHLNLNSYVEHDCVIGDFVTFAPAVRCNGNVRIDDGAYIGSNAVIRQGVTIGAGATIGMGAVVTKDVPEGEVWAGNPARRLGS